MHEAKDTFARFLEALAKGLDEPVVRGETLAARAFLSRSQFDRVVAGTAGEPPGRFRRRILLERAAHQLRTTRAPILDVAIGAGYSSNEAFTRAFRRAYGTVPSDWRRSARTFVLPSPNRVHYHPPGGLRLPARKEWRSMDLTLKMLEHHVFVIGEFIERARALPPAELDREITASVEGIDEHPTIRSLLSRLVGQMAMWSASMKNREYDFDIERDESLDSISARLEADGQAFVEAAREICEAGMLDETFVDAVCEPPQVFSYGGMLAHVLTYAAHRRTLVAGALASAGAREVMDDPLQWMAPST